MLALMLTGCASAEERELGAVLAPLCVFNCVISVTYAPGLDELDTRLAIEQQRKLLRE